MHNLHRNARRNQTLVRKRGGEVRVVELDWANPEGAQLWPLPSSGDGHGSDDGGDDEADLNWQCEDDANAPLSEAIEVLPPVPCPLRELTSDIVLATEVLYTEAGTAHFVAALAKCLRKPHGACFLMNNVRRTGVARLESECARHGLRVVQQPTMEWAKQCKGVVSTFAPPWDEDAELFTFLKIEWRSLGPSPAESNVYAAMEDGRSDEGDSEDTPDGSENSSRHSGTANGGPAFPPSLPPSPPGSEANGGGGSSGSFKQADYTQLVMRYIYKGETLKNGRVMPLADDPDGTGDGMVRADTVRRVEPARCERALKRLVPLL